MVRVYHFIFPGAGQDAVRLKAGGNFIHAGAFRIFSVNAPDNLCLIRINDQISVTILPESRQKKSICLSIDALQKN